MITPRTECIIKNITKRNIADIGTDHAYIPIYLIKNNICDKVIATDIKKGPLEIAKYNINKYNLLNKIEVRLGNGFECIKKDECEQSVIAGMGGNVICNILSDLNDENMQLILQPMNYQYELRKYLLSNNYKITYEDIAMEGFKVYNVICAKKGIFDSDISKDIYFHIPKELSSHKYFENLLEKKKREFLKILTGNKKSIYPDKTIIEKYENLLSELESLY